jgi:hypothetical protein
MTKREATKVANEMEEAGFNTSFRRWDGSYSVDGTDRQTGISITIHTVEAWGERKAAREF